MPYERIFLSPPDVGREERAELLSAFDSNYIAPVGPQLEDFEKTFRELTGFEHCVAVASGTAAIHLALRGLGVKSGDIVLASTLTFIGSVSPITFLQGIPYFIDCDRGSWTMDIELLRETVLKLRKEGKSIGAIIPTDLYGQSCDLDAIVAIGREHGIPVLCDSAEALGSTYRGKSVGKGADAAIFSFNGNKILTTSGGGILASDNGDLVKYAKYLATQAREPVVHFEHVEIGYNYRMSNLLAAVGAAQLRKLEDRVRKRRQIFRWYQDRLGGREGIELMPEKNYGLSNRWLTCLTIDREKFGCSRKEVMAALEAQNIEARPVWKPMHLQPCFRGCLIARGSESERLWDDGLCLPSGSRMSKSDVDRVARVVLKRAGNSVMVNGASLRNHPERGVSVGKRVFDVVVSSMALVLLGPFILLGGLVARKGSSGSGIFSQKRIGLNSETFTCFKIRTMFPGTIEVGTHEVPPGSITGVGRILRITKLDELPQLWNVVLGDMSLVGPRPCLPVQVQLIEERKKRGVYDVLPGITGLSQVEGIDMSDPVKLAERDADYVRDQSFLLDLKILLWTVMGKGSGDRVRQDVEDFYG